MEYNRKEWKTVEQKLAQWDDKEKIAYNRREQNR